MKLHWSPRSPYVRKVMIVAHETGLADRLELVRSVVAMSKPNPDVMRDNPLGKIPTLVTDDGTVLFDSIVICEYFDLAARRPKLFPPPGPARWQALRWHALGDGMLDTLILCRNEREQPPAQQNRTGSRTSRSRSRRRWTSSSARRCARRGAVRDRPRRARLRARLSRLPVRGSWLAEQPAACRRVVREGRAAAVGEADDARAGVGREAPMAITYELVKTVTAQLYDRSLRAFRRTRRRRCSAPTPSSRTRPRGTRCASCCGAPTRRNARRSSSAPMPACRCSSCASARRRSSVATCARRSPTGSTSWWRRSSRRCCRTSPTR